MSADDLANNIKDVTHSEPGYMINYGTILGRAVPADESEIDTLAGDIKVAAGESKEFKATLLDKDGNVVSQQMIMWTQGFTQYMTIGLRLGDSMVKMVTPSVSLDSVINGHRVTISTAEVETAGDAYKITIPIPYLVFAAAMADGEHARVGVSIGINYNSFFDATFRLNLPISKLVNNFSGGASVELPSYEIHKATDDTPLVYNNPDSAYNGMDVKQEIAIDAGSIPGVSDLASQFPEGIVIGNFGEAGGGIIVEVDSSDNIHIVSDSDYLLDALKNSREDDGSLVIDMGGGEEPIVIEKEQMDSLITMIDELIEQYPELGGLV